MQPWDQRAVEEANLFNPAFCAMLLAKTADEFVKKAHRPLPFALAFLILPIVLHQSTRAALPISTVTSLLPWIQDHGQQLVDFSVRVKRLVPITREAIVFGIACQTLGLNSVGEVLVGNNRRTPTEKRTELFTSEARECVERSGFVGRWFAAAGTTATIYAAWGVAP
jgi:Family of unknown function (DUF6521)